MADQVQVGEAVDVRMTDDVVVAAEPVLVVEMPAPLQHTLTKRHRRLLGYLWNNSDVHMPVPQLCRSIAALLGLTQQRPVTTWFAQQREKARAGTLRVQDENAWQPVHTMDDVVSLDELVNFVQSVRMAERSGMHVPLPRTRKKVAAPAVVEVATAGPMGQEEEVDAMEAAAAVAIPQAVVPAVQVPAVQIVRGETAGGTGNARVQHAPEQVEIMARAFSLEPRLVRADFRKSPAGVALLDRTVVALGGRVTRKNLIAWMARRPEKIRKMIFVHEDTLDERFKKVRRLLCEELSKNVLPFVLSDPKVLLQARKHCPASLVWWHLAPTSWQQYALSNSEAFVQWMPQLLFRDLNATHARHALRTWLFEWQQCDLDGAPLSEPAFTWETFEAWFAPTGIARAELATDVDAYNEDSILRHNPMLLVHMQQDGDTERDNWHRILFPGGHQHPQPTAVWRCLMACVWLRRIDALLTDAVFESLCSALKGLFALFRTQAERTVLMKEIYHVAVMRGQEWLAALVPSGLLNEDQMDHLTQAIIRWSLQVSERLTRSLTIVCNELQFQKACREMFQQLSGYLERKRVRDDHALNHAAAHLAALEPEPNAPALQLMPHILDDAQPLVNATPFAIPTTQQLDRAFVQLGNDLAHGVQLRQ